MQSVLVVCILFQAICPGTADEKVKYDQDGGIISVLLKKISDLEERDLKFDKKLEEFIVLKERLDEAQRQLAHMQELEYKLQKAEKQIRMLVHGVDDNNTDYNVSKSGNMKVSHPNETRDNIDIGSSGPVWILREVSNIKSRQAEMGDKIEKLLFFRNRILTEVSLQSPLEPHHCILVPV
ncbi:hypothetical protein CHS0354_042306 [Potamilus streckersoni]|uniref:Uncharacterized protein n=1 Tax=Potamilus streckersoni TaxID=2493646 RepID=A0AAE0STW8_9BIVA|nr:hypothetical protein CHS0354_042306 [Potamilus streckersoni]